MRPEKRRKLTLYRRGKTFWIAGRDRVTGELRRMSLQEQDPAIAKAVHEDLEDRWNADEPIFPGQRPASANGELADSTERWLIFKRGRVAPKSHVTLASRIRAFTKHCPATTVARVSRQHVEAYLTTLLAERAPATHNAHLSAIRSFFDWCVSHRLRRGNPADGIAKVSLDDPDVAWLDAEEKKRVLEAARKLRGGVYYAAAATALYAGLRRGEVEALERRDVDLKAKVLVVRRSKTRKARQVPVSTELARILKDEFKRVGLKATDRCFPVFVNSDQTRQKILKELRGASGVDKAGWNCISSASLIQMAR